MCFVKYENLRRGERQYVHNVQNVLKTYGLLEENECITGVFEEFSFVDTMDELISIVEARVQDGSQAIKVCSLEMYDAIKAFKDEESLNVNGQHEAHVETKYKSVAKKVKPVALPLPIDCKEKMEQASLQPNLRDPKRIGHRFTTESLKELNI